ncbi:MAG: hypothetical protein RI896_1429, partial [Pseudomonadota bacterium]
MHFVGALLHRGDDVQRHKLLQPLWPTRGNPLCLRA